MSANKSIIIKKVKKVSGNAHHGGAWKVAYADFVTAMMAFFLLLWLLNMSSDEKRIRLSRYFKHFSIYTEGGTSFMGKASEIFNESGESADKVFRNPKGREVISVDSKKRRIETGIAAELGGAADQVIVDTTEDGIRIQLIDKKGNEMLEQGKTTHTPEGTNVKQVVSDKIKDLPNKLSIEGHTDAMPVEKDNYGNWELSSERALVARRSHQVSGVDPQRVSEVSGFADRELLVKDNPADPSNRRISIILHKLPDALAEDGGVGQPKYSIDNPAGENIKLTSITEKTVFPEPAEEIIETGESEKGMVKTTPVIDEEWIPVIDEADNQPVLDEGWAPVIENENIPLEKDDWPEPVREEETEGEVVAERSDGLKKLPYIKLYKSERAKSGVLNDFNSPVILNGNMLDSK